MSVVKYVKADSENFVNYTRIRTALNKMQELMDILDSMNEPTYGMFEDNCAGDIYTLVSDSIITLTQSLQNKTV